MGFWSSLGKIAIPALGAAAAPFTGGASLAATLGAGAAGAATGLSQVLGKSAEGSAAQRSTENQVATNRDRAAVELYNEQMKAATRNPATFSRQAFIADTLANRTPRAKSPLSGGNAPQSAFGNVASEGQKSAMDELKRQAMLNLLDAPTKTAVPTAPALTPLQTAGTAEKLMGAGAVGSGVVGAIAEALKKKQDDDLSIPKTTTQMPEPLAAPWTPTYKPGSW